MLRTSLYAATVDSLTERFPNALRRRLVSAAALLPLGCALTACGGGGDSRDLTSAKTRTWQMGFYPNAPTASSDAGLTLIEHIVKVIGACALGVAAAAFGADEAASNASSARPAAGAPDTVLIKFDGSAYLKSSNTVLYNGKSYGMARDVGQAAVDQCNGFRGAYHLSAVSPPETTMASLDVFVHEKYFDTDKALTVITGKHLALPDFMRWMADDKSADGSLPAVPPDCTRFTITEGRNGTLWRDGLIYELRYDTRKAIGRRAPTAPNSFTGNPGTATFAKLPKVSVLGQSCREVVGGAVAGSSPDSHACIWDVFPYVKYLNWPYALTGHVQFGPTAQSFETIVPIAIERGRALPSSVFEIPADFTVSRP